MRVLVTEIGSNNSGDEAICLGAARRLLAMEAQVTFCYRVSLEGALRKAGIYVDQVHMPMEEPFHGIGAVEEMISVFAGEMPEFYRKMQGLLLKHDLVAVAPGGKFTEGYKNARTLLTAAMALSLGLPVIILHQSVGPMDNPNHLNLLTEVFKNCTLILIRDDRSLNYLIELGIPSSKIARCRDVAMGEYYPAPTKIDYGLGINIRTGFNGHVNLEVLSRFVCAYKALRPDERILIYSTSCNLPPGVVNHLSALPCDVQIKTPSYPDYLREVGRCAVNVSDSFHGSIFSMMAGRPVVCCQTDFKTWKLKGLPGPEHESLEVLPGLIIPQDAEALLSRVIAVRDNPGPVVEYQRRLVEYGRELCERGWAAVQEKLGRF